MKNYRSLFSISALALCITILSACQNATSVKNATITKSEKAATEKPHWEYAGEHGPNHWVEVSDDFAMCAAGKLQSPFNISADITAKLPALGLNYQAAPMKIINNGHTIQADQTGGGTLNVDGKTYDLLQFHFHTGSEYAIDGKSYPLEVHFVHVSDAGELAVVGVMFEEGDANTELAKIWENMPANKGGNTVDGQSINALNLLPDSKKYYRFMGSLTTPPCSEGVNWHMMSEPITASAEQIAEFREIYPMNARPLQKENNRLVVLGQ